MLAKNLPASSAFWKIPFRILLDAIAAWKGVFEGNPGFFTAIVKAHFYFIKWSLTDRKKSIFSDKKNGKLYGWYNGSVVYCHFIKKKKTFSEIVGNK